MHSKTETKPIKDTDLLNRFSLVMLVVLLLLPLIYLLRQNLFTTYVDAFDKLSIPLDAAFYSWFWIRFHRRIKKLEYLVPVHKDRVESYRKIANKEYLEDERKADETFSNVADELAEAKSSFDGINISLRVAKCNELFSKYENDLANFLGVTRAMNNNNAKKGSLKFKSPDKTFYSNER